MCLLLLARVWLLVWVIMRQASPGQQHYTTADPMDDRRVDHCPFYREPDEGEPADRQRPGTGSGPDALAKEAGVVGRTLQRERGLVTCVPVRVNRR
jgi:hypothetical protein